MIKTYKDLKDRVWEGEGIPKWIYRSGSFDFENLPTLVKAIYEKEIIAKNPGYELFYFSDTECKQFIIEEWGQEYLDLYNILIPTAYKADLFRYLLLYKYGGIWGDFTQVPLVSFDELISDMNRVLCLDRPAGHADLELYNAIMMVKPNDEVVANAITISKGNILGRKYCENPLDITGPVVLGQAYRASSCHGSKFNFKIPVGNLNGSKILLNPDMESYVVDETGKRVFVKKINNHRDILYRNNNKHYYQAWIDKTVF